MARMLVAALAIAAAGASVSAEAAAQEPSPFGVWLTKNGKSHVELYQCGAQLCGRIVWLREPNLRDGKPARDLNNPDPAKRQRPILGLEFLYSFAKAREPAV